MYTCQKCGFSQTEAQGNRCDVCNSKDMPLDQVSMSESSASQPTGQIALGCVAVGIALVLLIAGLIMNAYVAYFNSLM